MDVLSIGVVMLYYVKWTIIDMGLKSNRLLTGNTLTSIRESRLYRR